MLLQPVEYIQQFGRFQRNARLYLINNALSGVTTGIILVLYNLYLTSLGYGTDFIGLVLFIGTIGAGVAIFPAGICIDRLGGKFVLIWSTLLIGFAGIGQILFRQPLPLLVSGFIAGAAFAFWLVVNAPFLTRNSTPVERPHLFSLNIVLGLVTTVLGSVLGGALPTWFRSIGWLMGRLPWELNLLFANQPDPRSYQLAMLLAGAIALPSFIPLFLLHDDRPGRNVRRGAVAEQEKMVQERSMAGLAPVMPNSDLVIFDHDPVLSRLTSSIFRLPSILRSPLFLLILVQAFIGAGAGLFIPYFNIYFVQHLKASPALFGVLSGSATAINALMTLAAPWLAMRVGKVNSVSLTQLLSIPLLIALGLTSVLPLAATLYLFRQGFMDMSNGVLQVFSMEAVPEQHRGLANSSYQVAFQVPWALSAPLGGILIAHSGYPVVFIGGAVCYLLACATLWGNFGGDREKRSGRQKESIDAKNDTLIAQ
ncbi:MAG: hypothetical protein NVSMB33_12960 [Ktedonobacteraceae bacterium]